MPNVVACNFCEFESLPQQPLWTDGLSGSHRCSDHRGICILCKETFGPDVQTWRDMCDRCTLEFIEHRGTKPCVVCTEQYYTSPYGDHVLAAVPGTKRCIQHTMHCAACQKHSVEDDAEDICARCKRYTPAWQPKVLDMARLVADNMFCLHTGATTRCGTALGDCCCRCIHCYQYNSYYPATRLPQPPTEEEELREALFQKILCSGEYVWARLAGSEERIRVWRPRVECPFQQAAAAADERPLAVLSLLRDGAWGAPGWGEAQCCRLAEPAPALEALACTASEPAAEAVPPPEALKSAAETPGQSPSAERE